MASTKSDISLFIPQLSMFLLFFGITMTLTATQLMIWNKTCLANGYDKDVCDHLHQHPDVEDEVQGKAYSFSIAVPLLAFVPSAFLTLVLGPLSDVYGRKKILLIPVVTGTLSAVVMLIQSQQVELSGFLIYGGNLLIGLGGGLGTFMSTLISYVTDSTPPEHRTERLSLLLPFFPLGQTIGTLCSGFLWEQAGASVMYLITFLTYVIIIISILFLQETSKTPGDDDKAHNSTFSIRGLLRNVTAGWRVVSAPRQNGRRKKLLMLLVIGPAAIFFNTADLAVVSLCTRRAPFQWTPSTLSYFNAAKMVANVLGTALLAPLYIKITGSRSVQSDLTVMCISFGSALLQCLVMVAASTSSHLLITPVLIASMGAVGPASRSLLSKLVLSSEIGALNGFLSFLNNLMAAVGSVLIVSIYTKTVHTFPGAAYLAIMASMIGCLLIVLVLKNEYRKLPEADEKKDT